MYRFKEIDIDRIHYIHERATRLCVERRGMMRKERMKGGCNKEAVMTDKQGRYCIYIKRERECV